MRLIEVVLSYGSSIKCSREHETRLRRTGPGNGMGASNMTELGRSPKVAIITPNANIKHKRHWKCRVRVKLHRGFESLPLRLND